MEINKKNCIETGAKQRFYSTSQAAKAVDLPQSTLLHWETKFPSLAPQRSPKGTRRYTVQDIEELKKIRYLTHERGLTLDGAKKILQQKNDEIARKQQIAACLKEIREELLYLAQLS